MACLQGSVSAANEHWINPKQYVHFSLLYSLPMSMLSYSFREILNWQATDVLMHPKFLLDSLNKLIQAPDSSPSLLKKEWKTNVIIFIIIILFWGLFKQVLYINFFIYHCVFNSSCYNLSIVLCAKILPCFKIMLFLHLHVMPSNLCL